MYKLPICKVDFKYAPFYVDEARKMGYKPYRTIDKELQEEYFTIDVLDHEQWWRSPDMKFTSYGEITEWKFKNGK